jgi:hypothetical protein
MKTQIIKLLVWTLLLMAFAGSLNTTALAEGGGPMPTGSGPLPPGVLASIK